MGGGGLLACCMPLTCLCHVHRHCPCLACLFPCSLPLASACLPATHAQPQHSTTTIWVGGDMDILSLSPAMPACLPFFFLLMPLPPTIWGQEGLHTYHHSLVGNTYSCMILPATTLPFFVAGVLVWDPTCPHILPVLPCIPPLHPSPYPAAAAFLYPLLPSYKLPAAAQHAVLHAWQLPSLPATSLHSTPLTHHFASSLLPMLKQQLCAIFLCMTCTCNCCLLAFSCLPACHLCACFYCAFVCLSL